jgi:hypothetical protein
MSRAISVGVLMDLPPGQAHHVATLAALEHAAGALAFDLDVCVVGTDQRGYADIDPSEFEITRRVLVDGTQRANELLTV